MREIGKFNYDVVIIEDLVGFKISFGVELVFRGCFKLRYGIWVFVFLYRLFFGF